MEYFPSHQELVDRSVQWLKTNPKYKCRIVLSEVYTNIKETPDVIGFSKTGRSVLIECKASRSDFLSDKKKPFRKKASTGIGAERFYACPRGLIHESEVPSDWGLIWIYENQIRIKVRPKVQKFSKDNERKFLISVLAKLDFLKPLDDSLAEYTQGFKTAAGKKQAKRSAKRKRRRRRTKKS